MPLTRAAVREIDRRAVEEYGIPGVVLMENAGRNAAELLARLNSHRERVAILCGPGNNGGDGFVIARHLDRLGITSSIFLVANSAKPSPDAATNFGVVEKMGLTISHGHEPPDLSRFGWVVDALFGTGLDRPIAGPTADVVNAVNASAATVFAVDIPSGLDCDSGLPAGPCVRAHHTVTFVGMKVGFLTPAARPFIGEIHFADIGVPRRLVEEYL